MLKGYEIKHKYLHFPIKPGHDERLIEIYGKLDGENIRISQFYLPVDWENQGEYEASFYASIPTILLQKEKEGFNEIIIQGDAPGSFFDAIEASDDKMHHKEKRPAIHFTSESGWSNDPNGLIYLDGIYHLYYQYNPFHIKWNNMCWGHAISKDLLHWQIEDIVMIPDEKGTIFSGSGIVNKRSLLGLTEHAMIYFYTKAGNGNEWSRGLSFTQNIAFSSDQGMTLHKIEKPCVDVIERESRDPKVFWHEESQAYIMVLWIQGCEYAILRSTDLENWEESQRLEFEGTWECPDLFQVFSEKGESCWFFWCADGFCFPGDFDGYHFHGYGETHRAYLTGKPYENGLPYAAQTYSNVDGRLISIPWLRLPNDGRLFTGSYGIPVEFSLKVENGQHYLIQKPIRELLEQMQLYSDHDIEYHNQGDKALLVEMEIEDHLQCKINETMVSYHVSSGLIQVGDLQYETESGYHNLMMIVDDVILEIFFDGGKRLGTFRLKENLIDFQILNHSTKRCILYDVK